MITQLWPIFRHFHTERYSTQNLTLPSVAIVEKPKPDKKVATEKPKVAARESNVPSWMKKLEDRKKGTTTTTTSTTSAESGGAMMASTSQPTMQA